MNPVSEYFDQVPDPRQPSNAQRHLLLDLLSIALCAMLSGAEAFTAMESFGQEKHQWLKERLGLQLPGGIPSHDTFRRLFAHLNPQAFGAAMQAWTQALQQATQGQVIALDGKSVRRSFDTATGKGALHLVNAWASHNRLVLASCEVDQKSNEIKAIPTLLEMLDIRGCIVTTDALNTQKEIARTIVDKGGDYVLALKDNHALLHQEVRDYFHWCQKQSCGIERLGDGCAQASHWGHGRHEKRRCFVVAATVEDWPQALQQWPGLQSLVMIESSRTATGAPTEIHERFYLSSLPCEAARLLEVVRSHWGVENNVHWCLDVVFDEDGSRVRKDHAPQNLAILRRLALNLLRQETTAKNGLKARRLRAAWNSDYLLRLLCGPAS
jgi:predicted transposase YbfD/YdcC